MSSINFDNAYLLLIAIPLAVLLAVPFFIAVRRDNANGHNIASGVIHLVMALLVAFTAAGTKIITTVTETNVYVVADVSYSADKNLDLVDEYVRNVSKAMPKNSRMGVICFAKNYKLITRLGEKFQSVKGSEVDNTETNIAEALDYAGTLFRPDVIKRIVLITDGKQSYEGDSGALKRSVDALVAKNIHVDAMFLDDNIKEGEQEVQISDVEFSQNVYKGHRETATAVIQSSYEVHVIAELYQDSEFIAERSMLLAPGTNSLTFNELVTAESGTYDYEIRISASGDKNTFNNSFYFTQNVTESLKVLLVTDSAEDSKVIKEMYGESAEVDAYVNSEKIPGSIEALCKYDEIVLSNVDLRRTGNYEKFLESLNICVSLFGKSLLTFGNVYVQDCENNELEVLDKMLPVNFGNVNRDSKLYTIVIDGSRSMGFLSKMTRAKLAACKLVDLLNDNDKVCVVVFHGDCQIIQPVTDASNRDMVKQNINDIGLTRGTMLNIGLKQAYKELVNYPEFNQKQVMVISDGLTFDNGTGEQDADSPQNLVDSMRKDGIATSVIDVGRGADNSPDANAAAMLLSNLASIGGGTYHLADTEQKISEVIIGEINSEANETIVNSSTAVKISRPRDETVSGLTDKIEKSYLNGYMNNSGKGSATTVLTVTYKKPGGGTVPVPLYSYMKHGNGKTFSFTSSVSGEWAEPWKAGGEDSLFGSFFENVLESAIPEQKIDTPYVTDIVKGNSYASVSIAPAPGAVHADSEASVSVTLPSGEKLDGNMIFDSSVYSYGFSARDIGKYTVTVTYSYAGADYVSEYSFTVPYLSEYDAFTVFEASPLYKMLGANGTVSENGKIDLTNSENETALYTVDLTVPLLIACVVLFAVDVIIRKLKWDDIKSLFNKVNK